MYHRILPIASSARRFAIAQSQTHVTLTPPKRIVATMDVVIATTPQDTRSLKCVTVRYQEECQAIANPLLITFMLTNLAEDMTLAFAVIGMLRGVKHRFAHYASFGPGRILRTRHCKRRVWTKIPWVLGARATPDRNL